MDLAWTVRNLIGYATLRNPKNKYIQEKLLAFLRMQRSRVARAELLASSQLPEDANEGFRIFLDAEGPKDQYFEFLRKKDGTYAFCSTITTPDLIFVAEMSPGVERSLDYAFGKAINQLLLL